VAKQALGKGLDALFNTGTQDIGNSFSKEEIAMIPIGKIDRNPEQPRKSINDEEIENLSQSIKEKGVLQPILVVKRDDRYMIVAGERRYLASSKAGLQEIPCLIRELSENEILEIALIENIQREDLNPVEEAFAFKSIIEKTQITQEDLSKKIGKSRVYITNSMRLLNLTFKEREKIISGKISKGHAIALLQIPEEYNRETIIRDIEEKGLSVRETEELARKVGKNKEKQVKELTRHDLDNKLFIQNIEEKLMYKFNTKVKIQGNLKKGKIIIEYNSKDDLDKIMNHTN